MSVTRLRALSLALLLTVCLLALPGAATAAPTTLCSATEAAFCLTYDASVSQTLTQRPADVTLSVANASTNHPTDPSVWIRSATGSLLSSQTSGPLVLGSAQMPDHLLVAGSSAGCKGDDSFNTCTNHGTIVAHGQACGLSPTYCSATFGIQRVYSDRTNLGAHFVQLTVIVDYCVNSFGSTCQLGVHETSFTVPFDRATSSAPLTYTIQLGSPPTNLGVDDWAMDSLTLALRGSSSQLADGTVVPNVNWLRLPAICGTVAVAATVNSSTASVSDSRSVDVTGCGVVRGTSSRSRLTYGQTATLAGSVTTWDTHQLMPGTEVDLRTCPVGLACTVQKTVSSTGKWSFPVKPARTTTYSVRYVDPGVPGWVPPTWKSVIKVAPIVTIKASTLKIKSGGSVKLTGAVKPAHPGKTVAIQRKIAGVWTKISSATLSTKSLYAKTIVLKGAKGSKALLRVVLPAHADHLAGVSKTLAITFS
jgi:hypothetical protein